MSTPSPGRLPAEVPAQYSTGQTATAHRGRAEAPGAGDGAPADLPEPGELRALSLDELRTLRRQAQSEESDLSYVRRLLQGRIDILQAEQRRRCAPDGPVVEQLPAILTDGPARHRSSARHVTIATPAGSAYRRLVERMLAEVELSDLGARTDGELLDALGRLARYEAQASQRRQALQRTADGCGGEITRRYRDGEAQIDDLLS